MRLTSHNLRNQRCARRLVLLSALVFTFTVTSYSQTPKPVFPSPADTPLKDGSKNESKDDDIRYGSPEAEMRKKLEIKEEKKRYDEHVARAKEVSQLASQVSHSYETHKALSAEDDKRIERLEKLTKRIRNDSGGAENRDDVDRDIPEGMDQTLKKISEMANELEKLVENTPRNVVSAAVIDQANKMLWLIQHIRGTTR